MQGQAQSADLLVAGFGPGKSGTGGRPCKPLRGSCGPRLRLGFRVARPAPCAASSKPATRRSKMYSSTAEQDRRAQVQALAEQLYRERYSYLLRIARANGANGDDASDSVNDAFAAFIEKFDPDSGAPPLAWVTTTLKRRCWAIYRSQHLDRRVSQEADPDAGRPGSCIANVPSEAAGVTETLEQAEWIVDARQRLACLKPAERRALVLIAAGYSYTEIATMNQWTLTKVNRSAAEGRAALKKDQRVGSKQTCVAPTS